MSNNTIPPALRPVIELETLLKEMLQEHRKLLMHLEVHQAAMQSLNVPQMESCRPRQEATRLRILKLEERRKTLVQQIARINQLKGEPKIPVIADLYPQRRQELMSLRTDLQAAMKAVADRSYIATRLASAVLGHLNTAMRIVATAVGSGGVYTNRGTPRVTGRLGVIEAVG